MRLTRRQMIGLLGAGAVGLLPLRRARRALARGESGAVCRAQGCGAMEPNQRKALSAAMERILPGAVEAGTPDYLDYWVARQPFSVALDWKPLLKKGAVELDQEALKRSKLEFAACPPEIQDAILRDFQEERVRRFPSRIFFERLMRVTLEGYLSDPKYGGNRNQTGWRFIGREHCWWAPKKIKLILHPEQGFSD